MRMFIDDALLDSFAQRALLRVRGGGAEIGEIQQAVSTVLDGGDHAWAASFSDLADKLVGIGDRAAEAKNSASARDAYLRASTYYDLAGWPLFGAPVDPRLVKSAAAADDAFAKAMALADHRAEYLEIDLDGLAMPAWFLSSDPSGTARRTIINTNGYDSNVHEMYFAHALPALERGWNVLLFDGPGQGRNLIRDGAHLRPDWENVVGPVIDVASARADVDSDAIVLCGWSLGGYLAPRAAATHADRLAALVADPGQWDQRANVVPILPLTDDEKAAFPDVDLSKLDPIQEWLTSDDVDPTMRWRIVGRGFWVNGVNNFAEYAVAMCDYTISDRAANITCPTLITKAEGDMLAANAGLLFDAVGANNKVLVEFSASDGAGGHCETENRSVYNERVFAWLDTVVPAT